MTEKIVDLHNHTCYSDGTMTPEEILAAAIAHGVGVFSVTDHDTLKGTLEVARLAKDQDIRYIPGVELDSLDNGNNIHILGYGMDMVNKEFVQFVEQNWVLLDTVNAMLIDKMQADYDNISLSDYREFEYDRRKGGWKALHYLLSKGLIHTLREGFAFYPQYECTYNQVHFLSIAEVCGYIHRAGGKAVLAHPGISIKEPDMVLFERALRRLVSDGPDGIECYYPTHTPEITDICLKLCRERDLMITCGSDCHGTFGFAEVGQTNTPLSRLNLKGLLP